MLNEAGITRGQALRFMFLPQLLPRIGKLFGSGFINLPYFIVVVLNTVRIIPNNHPFLQRSYRKKYSIFQALAAGANNVPFNWKNADKVTILISLFVGMSMFVMQLILLVLAMIANPAFAYDGPGLGPRTAGAFIDNPNASTDLAFRLLDLVFGIPDIYNSSNMETTAFHKGLHALFEFYSYGILLVGVFIIIYLVTAIVIETAQSGIPFGQRFEKVWAPVRLILFFGLLLPATHGINFAQYLVLESARLGSNVASNAWITFDKAAKAPYLGKAEELIATPNAPNLQTLATFMALARVCSWAEGRTSGVDVRPYIAYDSGTSTDISSSVPAFSSIAEQVKGGTILIKFGVQDEKYKDDIGGVFANCGELAMPIVDQTQPGSALIQQAYLEMIPCLWSGNGGSAIECSQYSFSDMGRDYTSRYGRVLPYDPYPNMDPYIGDTQKTQILILLYQDFREAVEKAIERQKSQGDWRNDEVLKRGWAGASIWFNKVAEQNGAITGAIHSKPEVRSLPYVMEYVKREKLQQDENTPLLQLYTPTLSSGDSIRFETPQQREVALILNTLFKYWGSENALVFFKDVPETHNQGTTGNVIIDVINAMMGTQGLFDMCKNTDIHPLAQLSSLGRGLLEHSIRSFGMAAGLGVGAGIMALLEKSNFSQTLSGATEFFITFGVIGLMMGFMLFYVVPFLPFIYFFFAVMTWVKSIFEAMVGLPLWALAHLRIDGIGMPGEAAAGGYFYILEIFVRPTCILLGLLASLSIFAAMVKVLNEIFYIVLSNLTGHEITEGTTTCFQPPAAAGSTGGTTGGGGGLSEEEFKRGPIDEFFYTVIYTIIVYMIGTSCFKLVDLIPDRIMRWMGAGIESFGAQDGDPSEGLMTNLAGGISIVGGSLGSGFKKL